MKGLLLKDWYMITGYCRAFFLVDAVFIVVSVFTPENIIFLAYPCMFSAMIPMTIHTYDEKEKWIAYGAMLPVSRGQYVSVKYIIGMLSLVTVFLANLLVRVIVGAVAPEHAAEYMPLLLTATALGLLLPAIILPLAFRFGAEKARILYFILVGVVCAACFILMDGDSALGAMRGAPLSEGTLCAIALALYAVSWGTSIALYRRRDL